MKHNYFKYFIFSSSFFLLVLTFQSCKPNIKNEIISKSSNQLSLSGNGTSYDGKPGTYFRRLPNFECEQQSNPYSVIKVSAQGSAQLIQSQESQCEQHSSQLPKGSISAARYNPDYIGFMEGLFERITTEKISLYSPIYAEAWCRYQDSSEIGIDVVIKVNVDSMSSQAKFYIGESAESSLSLELNSVDREINSAQAKYSHKQFNLEIQRDAYIVEKFGSYHGTLTTTVNNKYYNHTVKCQLGGLLDPAINQIVLPLADKPELTPLKDKVLYLMGVYPRKKQLYSFDLNKKSQPKKLSSLNLENYGVIDYQIASDASRIVFKSSSYEHLIDSSLGSLPQNIKYYLHSVKFDGTSVVKLHETNLFSGMNSGAIYKYFISSNNKNVLYLSKVDADNGQIMPYYTPINTSDPILMIKSADQYINQIIMHPNANSISYLTSENNYSFYASTLNEQINVVTYTSLLNNLNEYLPESSPLLEDWRWTTNLGWLYYITSQIKQKSDGTLGRVKLTRGINYLNNNQSTLFPDDLRPVIFSSSGEYIIMHSFENDNFEFYLFSKNGDYLTQFTAKNSSELCSNKSCHKLSNIQFSEDETSLFYYSLHEGPSIYKINLLDKQKEKLADSETDKIVLSKFYWDNGKSTLFYLVKGLNNSIGIKLNDEIFLTNIKANDITYFKINHDLSKGLLATENDLFLISFDSHGVIQLLRDRVNLKILDSDDFVKTILVSDSSGSVFISY